MKRFILSFTAIAMICLAVTAVLQTSCSRDAVRDADTPNFYSEVRSINKLVLAHVAISKMATIDDLKLSEAQGPEQKAEAVIDALKIGDRVAAYSYSTYMDAFVDLSNLSPDDVRVDTVAKTVILHLPGIQTELSGRDITVKEEHYRVSGLRSDIDAKERAALKERMNSSIRKELASDTEIRRIAIETARSKGEEFFQSLCAGRGYTVDVTFGD